MRGLFTAGVLDVLMEHDIWLDGVIGVSAGALFGANYLSRQVGRALRYNILLRKDPRYVGLRSLCRTGDMVGADFAYHVVPFEIDVFDAAAFRSNPTPFWVVCTDIDKGEPVYHRMDEFNHHEVDWLRASGSMPYVSRIVRHEGLNLLDGGMTDSIPLAAFEQMGYLRNIVVLTQPPHYRKRSSRFSFLLRCGCRQYPNVAKLMASRPLRYNEQLDYAYEQAAAGNALIICPDEKLPIGRLDMNADHMRAVYQAGRLKAETLLPAIREFVSRTP